MGAKVTSYGEGMVERVRKLTPAPPDAILDTSPLGGALPDLIRLAAGEPRRVLTICDFENAKQLGVRHTFGEQITFRYDMLGEFALLAAADHFTIPVAQTFSLEQWQAALNISQSRRACGKLVVLL